MRLMHLRPGIPADVPVIVELERDCPTAAHWTEQQYRQAVELDRDDAQRLVLVAEVASPDRPARDLRSSLAGFLVARHIGVEWELENLVVAPSARRKGVGRQLLDALLAAAREINSESVFLEVRELNVAARKLYESAGFQLAGRRKSYYVNPSEDAVAYRHSLARPFSS